ncbi:hypothetical protein V8E36_004706 [Tilletia maclaganii]
MTTAARRTGPVRPLTEAEWTQLGQDSTFHARKWQQDILQRLFAKRDVLLIAPTGPGKSGLFRLAIQAWPELLWIIVVPLKDLEREQTAKIGGGALYINSDNRSKKLFDEVRSGKKNAVLVSPEMALSNYFLALFENEGFRSRLAGFIFDEVHAVVDWGDTFRTKMKELGQLRHQIGVPALAMSGTLSSEYRVQIRRWLELRSLDTVDLGCNRPNLCISIHKMQHAPDTYLDLLSFLPELWLDPMLKPRAESKRAEPLQWPQQDETVRSLTPTLIYHNDKSEIQQMWGVLRSWFERAGHGGKVTTFTADSSDSHNEELRGLIERREVTCVIATDALGMGADISSIMRVVQWGIAKETSPAAVLQRLGRAGRQPLDKAEGIIVAESWVSGGGVRETKHRSQVDEGLMGIVTDAVEGKGCIRQRFNQLMSQPSEPPFKDEELFRVEQGALGGMPCCGTCVGIETPSVPEALLPAGPPKADTLLQSSAIADDVSTKLLEWRQAQEAGRFRDRILRDPLGVAALLRDEDVADIVRPVAWADEVMPEIRSVIQAVLKDYEDRAQAAAQEKLEAQAQRDRLKEAREQEKFLQKCVAKKDEAAAKGVQARQCETCRKWLAE